MTGTKRIEDRTAKVEHRPWNRELCSPGENTNLENFSLRPWLGKSACGSLSPIYHLLFPTARVVEWQTRTFEGRMPKGMRVQVPPRARLRGTLGVACITLDIRRSRRR